MKKIIFFTIYVTISSSLFAQDNKVQEFQSNIMRREINGTVYDFSIDFDVYSRPLERGYPEFLAHRFFLEYRSLPRDTRLSDEARILEVYLDDIVDMIRNPHPDREFLIWFFLYPGNNRNNKPVVFMILHGAFTNTTGENLRYNTYTRNIRTVHLGG